MSNRKHKITLAYAGIQGSYSMSYAGIGSFVSVYLLAQGFSNSEIGLCVSLANLLAVFVQPVLADWADQSKKVELTDIISGIGFFMLAMISALFWTKGHTLLVFGLFVLALAAHGLLQPFINALNQRFSKKGYAINFGLCRSAGSVGFAMVTGLLGPIVTIYGNTSILIASFVCLALLLVSNFMCHKLIRQDTNVSSNEEAVEEISLGTFIRKNGSFIILNLGVMLVFYHVNALGAFLFQMIEPIGAAKTDMGFLFALMAMVEVPSMVFYSHLQRRFGSKRMLMVSMLGFVVKFGIFCYAKEVWMLYVSQAMQMVGYAIFYPAMVNYTAEIMSEKEVVKGQALFTIMMLIAGVISNITGGYFLDYFGVPFFNAVCFITCVVGAVLVCMMVQKIEIPSE
ncbi:MULTISPECIES: MFS transporter [Terrabacteria group]|uniref:MFS transporter n=1 Tax=Bacillati TaxID=1783272 RepID=UPI001C6F2C4B|nr:MULTISPECIES: MFS transporter [Terrabacteria group]MBW9212875.1 MFS transporter [Trueperella sp. zg.1013]